MITSLLEYINSFGYKAIFILIVIENIFPPIPCEIILTFGGFMTTITELTPLGVIAVASLGSYLGAVILYSLGYIINLDKLTIILSKLHFNEPELERAINWFERYGKISVLIGRLIPIIRSLISLPAGIMKMNFFSFSLYSLIGTIIWNTILVYLGIMLGNSWSLISNYIKQYTFVIAIVVFIIYLIRKRRPS